MGLTGAKLSDRQSVEENVRTSVTTWRLTTRANRQKSEKRGREREIKERNTVHTL